MHIQHNVGVGLTGINIIGESSLSNVHFYNNSMGLGETDHGAIDMVAGGAQFYFGDTVGVTVDDSESNVLHIADCTFTNSSSSASVTHHILVDEFFEIDDFAQQLHNGTYSLDGAAGLSLIFMRTGNVTQKVSIQNTQLIGNTHQHGGCMLILFRNALPAVSVTMEGVLFDNCRGGSTGGGLLVGFGYPGSLLPTESPYLVRSQTVHISNTIFQNCQGTWGGGAAVLSIPLFIPRSTRNERSISFSNCTWEANHGTTGSAVAFWEAKYHGVQAHYGLRIRMEDCTFSHHSIENELDSQLNAAVLNLDAVSVQLSGNTSFLDNKMSCIGATRSEMQVYGQFVAEGSQVIFGGVLDFRDTSYLIVKPGANIRFAGNEALWRGGAVSVNVFAPWPLTKVSSCFLHFNHFHACPKPPCYGLTDHNNTGRIEFQNNSAALLGNEIFGTTFYGCPWLRKDIPGHEVLTYLQREFDDAIHFHTNLSHSSGTVNSNMANLYFTDPNRLVPQSLMSGQQFVSRVRAVDYFNQTVPEISTLRVTADGRVDTSGNFDLDGNVVGFIEGEQDIQFMFLGNAGENVTFQFLPTSVFAPIGSYNFVFTKCRPGFVTGDDERCVCDPVLTQLHDSINCLRNGTISHGPQRWIGYLSDNMVNHTGDLYVTSLCVFDYCEEGNTLVLDLGDDSEQCSNNRRGILCGGCKEGYSRVLGSSACRICTNSTLAYMLLYVSSGFLIVIFIVAFKVFIGSGYLNGPNLYANIVATFASILFPSPNSTYHNIPFVLISFLNLSIDFETCFYDGMTEVELLAWRMAYPIYLFLIICGFSLGVKLCPNISFRLGLRPTSSITTVLFISFNSLIQICSETLGVAVLSFRGSDNEHSELRWLKDPTVRYGRELHGFLVAIAVLLLVTVLTPVVLVLLFYKFLRKVKLFKRLFSRWWPFFDAFHNPYVRHLRFWIGIQLLVRAGSLIIAGSEQLPNTTNVSLPQFSLFIMVLTLATFICIEAFLRPFKGILRNVLDLAFLLNLLYMLTSVLYYNTIRVSGEADLTHVHELHHSTVQTCLYSATVLIVFTFLSFVLVRFGLLRIIDTKVVPRLSLWLQNAVLAVLEDAGHTPVATERGANKQQAILINQSTKSTTVVVLDDLSASLDPQDGTDDTTESSQPYARFRDSILSD